ncbi:MAG: hypothetical protein IT373_34335 [Polyangiaceae bacterium]|nr:hypothetical protein [Polyangiaceae bacterium]
MSGSASPSASAAASGSAAPAASGSAAAGGMAAWVDGYKAMITELDKLVKDAKGDCKKLGEELEKYLKDNGEKIDKVLKEIGAKLEQVKNEAANDDKISDMEDAVTKALTDTCAKDAKVAEAAKRMKIEKEK